VAPRLLQVNYTLNVPLADFREHAAKVADAIAAVPGLRWKIWLHDPATGGAGGIYVFDAQPALDAFVNGPIIAALRANPAVRDVTVRPFDVLPQESRVTRAPVGA
jgi:hypothetical protein